MKLLNKFIKNTKSLIQGLATVLKHQFKSAVTEEYPEIRPNLNSNFRGQHTLSKSCTGCGLCIKVCPTDAIKIIKDENNNVISYKINLGKCIFCGQCTYYCPQGAIKHTTKFELATAKKENLVLELFNKEEEINAK